MYLEAKSSCLEKFRGTKINSVDFSTSALRNNTTLARAREYATVPPLEHVKGRETS